MPEKPIGERVARIEARQGDFDRWNEKQNGRLDRMDNKLGAIQTWLIGVMGSMIVVLGLTIVNIVMKV